MPNQALVDVKEPRDFRRLDPIGDLAGSIDVRRRGEDPTSCALGRRRICGRHLRGDHDDAGAAEVPAADQIDLGPDGRIAGLFWRTSNLNLTSWDAEHPSDATWKETCH